jgi:hypothetical protein
MRSRVRCGALGLLFVPLGWLACSSFSSSNANVASDGDASATLVDGAAPGHDQDGSTVDDGGTSGDGGTIDALAPAPVDDGGFVVFETFEGVAGCSKWVSQLSDFTVADVAHTGAHSCRVCAKAAGNSTIASQAFLSVEPGASYVLDFYARAAVPGVPGVAGGIQSYDGGGGIAPTSNFPPLVAVDGGAWTRITVSLAMGPSSLQAKVQAAALGVDAGECFYIDDMTFSKN